MENLTAEISTKINELNVSVKKLRETGTALATAERDYKILLSQESLKLRESGEAVGMIDKVVYGVKEVAAARFKRDVAKAIYDANSEAINAIKVQLRIYNDQWSAEWGAAKY